MNDYSKKTIIEKRRTHRAWTTIEIARGMYQTHAYKRSSDFTVIMLQLMLDSHAMRALRGGKIFEIERVVGWIARIPEQNGAMNRSVGCNNQSVKRGKAIVGDNMQHSIEQKCRSGARANFYSKRCIVGVWPRVGEICILERDERKFKVVCEQASDYALAWPSESSFLFLIFLFFPSRLFLFAFSFPLVFLFSFLHLFLQNIDSISEGLQPSSLLSFHPIRHVKLKSPRAIVEPCQIWNW